MLELLGVAAFALGLLASIALHEIGHLVPAKKFGLRVTQYMVGFGPTIWSRRRGETEYGIKAIPLGGYIRMVGMFPPGRPGRSEASGRLGTMIEEARAHSLAEIEPGHEHRAFYRLSAPRKLVVMFGGPVMNLVLAFVLFAVSLSAIGKPAATLRLSGTVACTPTSANPTGIASADGTCGLGTPAPATVAGLREGDLLVSINGSPVTAWDAITPMLNPFQGTPVVLQIQRSGSPMEVTVTPGELTQADGTTRAFIGITPTVVTSRQPLGSIPGFMAELTKRAAVGMASWPSAVAHLGASLITGGQRDPEGPVSVLGVGRLSGDIAAQDELAARVRIGAYVDLLASMNLFLFLFNMLPLLPLDGGHIAGAGYEGLRRTVRKLRGKADVGPADTARLLPLAYVVTLVLLAMSLVVMVADVVSPITLG